MKQEAASLPFDSVKKRKSQVREQVQLVASNE
jgi:hypothetical protein